MLTQSFADFAELLLGKANQGSGCKESGCRFQKWVGVVYLLPGLPPPILHGVEQVIPPTSGRSSSLEGLVPAAAQAELLALLFDPPTGPSLSSPTRDEGEKPCKLALDCTSGSQGYWIAVKLSAGNQRRLLFCLLQYLPDQYGNGAQGGVGRQRGGGCQPPQGTFRSR